MRTIYSATVFVCMVSTSAVAAASGLPTRTAALAASTGPSGPNDDVLFVIPTGIDLNNAGQVAFIGLSRAPDGTPVGGPFVSDPVRGVLSPPTTGADIVGLNPDEVFRGDTGPGFDLSETGRLTFFGRVFDADVEVGSAVVSGDADNGFGVTIRSGDQIDGAPTGTALTTLAPSTIVSNRVGGTLLRATAVDGGGNSPRALLRDVDGSGYTAVAVEGQQAPGLASGVEFGFFSPIIDNASFNDDGRVAFESTLRGPGVNSANDEALFTDRDGAGLSLLARQGQQVDGLASGVVYGNLARPTLNSEGEITAGTSLQGPGIDNSNDGAILKYGMDGRVDVLFRDGDPAPVVDAAFSGIDFFNYASNDAGDVAFLASLTDTTTGSSAGRGLFLARDDDDAVAIDLDVLGVDALSIDEGSLAMNEAGQVAFFAGESLYATDPSGELHLIVAAGSMIDVSDDPMAPELKTVAFIRELTILEAFADFSLNDRGEIAFFAQFSDSTTGIFVTTVPAPGSVSLVAVAGLAASRRRRR